MAPIPEKYKELLLFAANSLKGLLRAESAEDANVVQKGLLLYRQGLVSKVQFIEDSVFATVQDVTPVQVRLDLNFVETSICTCPAGGLCRHQLAVFFHAYSNAGSVAEWVEEWRQPLREKASAAKWGFQRAKDLVKANANVKPSYDNWISFFQESFDSIMTGQGEPRPYVIPELFQVYKRQVKASSPIEKEWKMLYELIAAVYSFQMLIEIIEYYGHSEEMVSRYYRFLFHILMEDAEDIVDQLTVHSLPFAFDEFIEKLKDRTGGLLFPPESLEYESVHLYRILWSGLFKQNRWREEERVNVAGLVKLNGSLPPAIAFVHQHILARQDREAITGLSQLKEDAVPYLVYWLELLSGQKAWKRLAPYSEHFVQQLNGYLETLSGYHKRRDFTSLALDTIVPFCLESLRHDLYERALVKTLPYSFGEYEDFLFQQGQLDKWGELQSFIGLDINELPKDRIKMVQKENPSVLLPLYHQSVQKNIDLKNRGNYREAVRHLKKLRTLYKKLKRSDDFERFLAELTEKTKRLRAFHEECKRGKLIDA